MTKEELKEFLQKHKLTQGKFSQMIGRERTTVYKWLSGKLPVPYYVEIYLKNIEKDLENAAEILKKIELKKEE